MRSGACGREEARRINAAEPSPEKFPDRLPASLFGETVAIDMGQHKTAKKEKQVDRKISTAPEPRRRAPGKVIGIVTAVEKQHTHCSNPTQRCKRRQLRRWAIGSAGGNVREVHLALPDAHQLQTAKMNR